MSSALPGRRKNLDNINKMNATTHVGLWLDKYLKEQTEGGGESAKTGHFDAVGKQSIPQVYQLFYERWRKALEQAGAVVQEVKTEGRLAIGQGEESVLETSITLHHTYGVPYIPGSALKGLAARYARNRLEEKAWGKTSEAYKTLFGSSAEAGYVTFFDALYIPGNVHDNQPLVPDVITVHHKDYYQEGKLPPADWDSPVPIPFLSATGGYLIALLGPESWVEAAFEILRLALKEEGIGAKTSSGYGRMTFEKAKQLESVQPLSATSISYTAAAPSLPRKSGRGKIKYDRGRPMIVNEEGQKYFLDWKNLGMDALKAKTVVEFEFEEPANAKPLVVKVRKL